MKLPLDWLLEFAQLDITAEEAAETLTMAGLEVEAVEEGEYGSVLDIKVTPNRGDCLSVIGVARELAAARRGSFRGPVPVPCSADEPPDAATYTSVTIEDPELCPRYVARIVEDLRVDESPEWMQRRLLAAGLRPISNIVDITNYVMLETGQPLHAFDYDTLLERRIVVRTAAAGETVTTLDGVERSLTPGMLVIADAVRPVAVAGVMGGADTEIRPTTRTLLLESAHFDRRSIRRTARALNLSTEASYRFERTVDPEGVLYAADRACQLIEQLGAGRIVAGTVDEYPRRWQKRAIVLRLSRCALLMGYEPTASEVTAALEALGFQLSALDAGRWEVQVPSWRADVWREEDLVEEVARVLGYDRIPERLMRGMTTRAHDSQVGRFREQVRDILCGAGLQEAVCHTLVSPPDDTYDKPAGSPVTLRTALSAELSCLRWSLLPGLCDTAARNQRRGMTHIAFFEVGPVFGRPAQDADYTETDRVGVIICGSLQPRTWHRQKTDTALYFVGKGVMERLLDALGIPASYVPCSDPRLHPGRRATIVTGDQPLGVLGELHPEYAARFDLRGRAVVFELDVERMRSLSQQRSTAIRLSRFPAVARDLAPRVPQEVPYSRVHDIILRIASHLLEDLKLTDVYSGSPIPEGYRSFTFSLTFRSSERTLTDAEVDALMHEMRLTLVRELGATFQEGL